MEARSFALKTWTGQGTEFGILKTYTESRFNFGNSAIMPRSPESSPLTSPLGVTCRPVGKVRKHAAAKEPEKYSSSK